MKTSTVATAALSAVCLQCLGASAWSFSRLRLRSRLRRTPTPPPPPPICDSDFKTATAADDGYSVLSEKVRSLDAPPMLVFEGDDVKDVDEETLIAAANVDTEANTVDISKLGLGDIDFQSSEMAPPFLDPNSCLVPGEPVIRVEKAPENSRRIFAGVDILASVDDVWNVLTQYDRLQETIPNLVVNEVLEVYDGVPSGKTIEFDKKAPVEVQCEQISKQMKGSLLKQVGGAKVAGINFSAKTTLEVREWPDGMPDFAHFSEYMWMGKPREVRINEYANVKLERYRFPRPFALSSLPTKDISMQSVPNDNGEFRMYQGVWRMQPLPGCAPPGKEAMRLTYAVEISPKAYLPVRLIEGRIARDLCTNLEAIRNAVSKE